MTHEKTGEVQAFASLGLSASILKSLNSMGYGKPTPIQAQAIPVIAAGGDVLGLAQTGTGKTAAFSLPIIDLLLPQGSVRQAGCARALILSPTRELANQIGEAAKMFVCNTHLRVAVAVGGQSINVQARGLSKGVDILVATPGRLMDLVERNTLSLSGTSFLVLDEADQMLDLGFIHTLRKIAKLVPKSRQTMLFSATMPKEIERLAEAFLTDPVRIEVAPPGQTADRIEQQVFHIDRRTKLDLLAKLLEQDNENLSIVFARTKHGAEKLKRHLSERGFEAASIHGNKSQPQRDRAIRQFKAGKVKVLVATDVAARGIDIPDVACVYNYELPEVPAQYVHRIGRTARAGKSGRAVALCAPDEAHLLKAIERSLGLKIPVSGDEPGSTQGQEAAKRQNSGTRPQGSRPATEGDNRRRQTKARGKSQANQGQDRLQPKKMRRSKAVSALSASKSNAGQSTKADRSDRVVSSSKADKPDSKKKSKRSKPRRWQRQRV